MTYLSDDIYLLQVSSKYAHLMEQYAHFLFVIVWCALGAQLATWVYLTSRHFFPSSSSWAFDKCLTIMKS